MDEKRTDLRAALRELAGEESGDIGEHVGFERLIAYRQGTLPAAERETVQEHLSLCPRCTGLLLELGEFEAAAASGETGPESLRQEAWDSLVRRLPKVTPAVRPIASVVQAEAQRRTRSPRFVVAAAAALLLAVGGLGLWTAVTVQERQRLARLEQRLEEREATLAGRQRDRLRAHELLEVLEEERTAREEELVAKIGELSSALAELRRTAQAPRGRDRIAAASEEIAVSVAPRLALRGKEATDPDFLRGGGVPNPVEIAPHEGRFTMALKLADQPAYVAYRLELNRDGKVLWAGLWPGVSFSREAGTSVTVAGLGPGLYRLRIKGLDPDRSELLAEYLLDVKPGPKPSGPRR